MNYKKMVRYEDLRMILPIILLIIVSIAAGIYLGILLCLETARSEAVKNNVAEWVVIDDCGKTEFRWKEIAK